MPDQWEEFLVASKPTLEPLCPQAVVSVCTELQASMKKHREAKEVTKQPEVDHSHYEKVLMSGRVAKTTCVVANLIASVTIKEDLRKGVAAEMKELRNMIKPKTEKDVLPGALLVKIHKALSG